MYYTFCLLIANCFDSEDICGQVDCLVLECLRIAHTIILRLVNAIHANFSQKEHFPTSIGSGLRLHDFIPLKDQLGALPLGSMHIHRFFLSLGVEKAIFCFYTYHLSRFTVFDLGQSLIDYYQIVLVDWATEKIKSYSSNGTKFCIISAYLANQMQSLTLFYFIWECWPVRVL